ncbi:MAG: plasmid pRiA4b ORF-3 family protein [Marinifilaceae bacterium]|jgi:hypothetical protein|nr:plasmid pRiA4b ORF-3 family protein [Marinifilaceae bacterium]
MNKNKFYFPDNYQEVIDNSIIVKDFEIFLSLAEQKKLELSKNGILSNKSSVLLNESVNRKIFIEAKRPTFKSYPNIIALFILYRKCGFYEVVNQGKKVLLKTNADLLKQWKEFSETEKYFCLFSNIFSGYDFEAINESGNSILFIYLLEYLKKANISAEHYDYFSGTILDKTNIIFFELFGLLKLKDSLSKDKKKWEFQEISLYNYTASICDSIYSNLQDSIHSEEIKNNFAYNKLAKLLADKLELIIPELKKRLVFNTKRLKGAYVFKIQYAKVWRKIKIDSTALVDDLCVAIIDAFNFDMDHMYELSYKTKFGDKIEYTGFPSGHISDYTNPPFTIDHKIEELELVKNQKLEFLFDFGDNWEFDILLEEIIESEKNVKTELIDQKGEAPEQYPQYWD